MFNTDDNQKDVSDKEVVVCELGGLVQANFLKAKNARVTIEHELLACLRQRKGEYSADELIGMGSAKTFVSATSTKCRAGEAWLSDILASSRDKPWLIKPTPIATVPDFIKDIVREQIKGELAKYQISADQAEQFVEDRANDLKEVTDGLLETKATKGTQRMTTIIQDQLAQGGFEQAFKEMRTDLTTYPFAVLKGPVVRKKSMLYWPEGAKTPDVKDQAVLIVERVSPFDFYWAPWAKNIDQGYCVEVMPMEYQALYDCMELPNFNKKNIQEVLRRYDAGYEVDSTLRTQRKQLEDNTQSFDKPDTIDVLDYWGQVKGEILTKWGAPNIADPLKRYKINAWVVDGLCIRSVVNPDPLGRNPYYVTSYEKVPGSMVGKSPPMLMRSHQEMINSAYRALRRNMGLAAGPFAEVDQSRLADGQAPEEILPGMVKLVESDPTGSGQPVYRFHNINSHASELIGVINNEMQKADDATGIPAYSYGNASGSGVGRTVGGLSLLMGNASKSIKQVIDHIEVDVLGPLIQAMYTYNMLFGKDDTAKVDAQVIARGPSGIIMREALIQRRLEALQLLTPYVQTGIVKPEGLAVLLREVLAGLDMPVDKIIPDPEKAQVLQAAAQAIQGVSAGTGVTPVDDNGSEPTASGPGQVAFMPNQPGVATTPQPLLDARSGLAGEVLNNL